MTMILKILLILKGHSLLKGLGS